MGLKINHNVYPTAGYKQGVYPNFVCDSLSKFNSLHITIILTSIKFPAVYADIERDFPSCLRNPGAPRVQEKRYFQHLYIYLPNAKLY